MKEYEVWYWKDPTTLVAAVLSRRVEPNLLLGREGLKATHACVGTFQAEGLEELFRGLQGEVWSPNGEQSGLIQELGLTHTSLSVGDVALELGAEIPGHGRAYRAFVCRGLGWKELKA